MEREGGRNNRFVRAAAERERERERERNFFDNGGGGISPPYIGV